MDQLMETLYEELRRMARSCLRRERKGHTLQPTALVHEAYLRLIDQQTVSWENRAQFFGLAATMMRRILVNYAKARLSAKRGGGLEKITLDPAQASSGEAEIEITSLHHSLERLAAVDQEKARLIELRYFGGLTNQELAELMGKSRATIEREWTFARAWLYRDLGA
jgi:RNA polymerase sigma factor (TIGR02999 family)